MPPDERDSTADTSAPPTETAGIVPPPPPEGAEIAPYTLLCRRCGETSNPVNNLCAWCGLWLVGAPPRAEPEYDDEDDDEPEGDWDTDAARRDEAHLRREPPPVVHPGLVIGVAYALLIGSLVVYLIAVVFQGVKSQDELYAGLAVVEIADAVLTVVALALVWRMARQKVPEGTRLITWVTAFPVLFALLCINIAYITFLRELLRSPGTPEPERVRVTLATILLICVQPAIVEELFFRQMVLGVFRKWMNMHGAVWVTAAMFAFAHITNPIGMPYLLLGGAVFGYARIYGGLTLAMIMHFLHNFAVIGYEAWK